VNTYKYAFLSRPRRFGKSLLTSTLHYYFEGRKELFQDLAMETLEKEWNQYPVLHFDLSRAKDSSSGNLTVALHKMLDDYDKLYEVKTTSTPGSRLDELIRAIYEKTGTQVVLLIDEYDAPIMNVLYKKSTLLEVRQIMREFYASLKANDSKLKFVFLTGVSTFSQMGIFSELNNLKKITSDDGYAAICGITEQELRDNFTQGIEALGKKLKISREEVLNRLKNRYDGYHFSEVLVDIYNPFSLLNAFSANKLGNYWFDSGTSVSLIRALQQYIGDFKLDVEEINSGIRCKQEDFMNSLEDERDIIPLLYQSGYITIKKYNEEVDSYVLGIPNEEVRVGLFRNLLPYYTRTSVKDVVNYVDDASISLCEGDIDKALNVLRSAMKSIPYVKGERKVLKNIEDAEGYYHKFFHFFFYLMYGKVHSEVRNSTGATDVEITTPKYIYVVEIKIDAGPEVALKQIEEKGYAVPHMVDRRAVYKVGVTFSSKERTISNWKIVKAKDFKE
jgi:hypothetical protein